MPLNFPTYILGGKIFISYLIILIKYSYDTHFAI
nr:MAG TPA: hypothetical protein [Caudoviricetes sp.]